MSTTVIATETLVETECNQNGRSSASQLITPPCHLVTLAKRGLEVYCAAKRSCDSGGNLDDTIKQTELELQQVAAWNILGIEIAEIALSGNLLGLGISNELLLIDTLNNFKPIATLQTGVCKRVFFSPKGTFVVVLTQYSSVTKENNLSIWRISDKQIVFSFTASLSQEKWPPVIWSDKETYCFRLLANDIIVYPGDLSVVSSPSVTIPVEKLKAFAPSIEKPDGSINLAVFTPPTKDRPGKVRILSLTSPTDQSNVCLNSKSFFQVQDIKLLWNCLGTALLAQAHTDVDSTGKSYYGTSTLYFIEACLNGSSFQIIGPDEGPVADCQWSPTANEFVLISGPIPYTINMHDGKTGEPKLSFGKSRRNCIRFNPFGRLICLAGFGNLAGEFDVWDKNKKKVIGSGKIPCTVDCEWAPDGQKFLSGITAPRMRVDNGVKIVRYNGDILAQLDIPDLYFAKWLTAPKNIYLDRPPMKIRPAPGATTTTVIGQPKSQPYRPPRACGAFQDRLRAEKQGNETQTTATVVSRFNGTTLPPGAEFIHTPSKSARRNAARRKKGKDNKCTDQGDTVENFIST